MSARRLILKMSLSLDGFVCGPDGAAGWLARGRDEAATAWIVETLLAAGVHAMGRRTYDEMAAYWPTASGPLAAPMNDIPKAVFTRRPRGAGAAEPAPGAPEATGWGEARVMAGDLASAVGQLRRQPGRDILAHGGAEFAQSLARLGLVDEYRLLVHPVALGAGRPLFPILSRPLELTLVGTSVFRSGVVAQVYRR